MRFGIDETHLGPDGTEADAARMVEILTADGWDVFEGSHLNPSSPTDAERDEIERFEGAFARALARL